MKNGVPGAMFNSLDPNEKEVEYLTNMCGSRGEIGGRDPPSPGKLQFIGFLSNTGWDPLKDHKDTKPEFHVGPSLAGR